MNYSLKVIKKTYETEDSVTISFKQPGLKKIKYAAGQYLTLIFRINGRRYIRPYSFSSCPGIDDYLEVTVKRVLNGIISNHIIDKVVEGDTIEAMSPMGDFVFDESKDFKSIYLWGVGSGITPLLSLAKHILSSFTNIKVYLIYGNRSSESTIFRSKIEDLQRVNVGNLTVRHFLTQLTVDSQYPNIVQGRIDQAKACEILTLESDLQSSGHYICGPTGLKQSVKLALDEFNVPLENIASEDFELIRNPEDFNNIATQNIELIFNNESYQIEVAKGKSILEAALDADIELPYSCQTGNCNTCKARLLKGEIKVIGLKGSREDLAGDELLTCCSHPLAGNVCIEI